MEKGAKLVSGGQKRISVGSHHTQQTSWGDLGPC